MNKAYAVPEWFYNWYTHLAKFGGTGFRQIMCARILQQGWGGLKFTDPAFGMKAYSQEELHEEHDWYTEEHANYIVDHKRALVSAIINGYDIVPRNMKKPVVKPSYAQANPAQKVDTIKPESIKSNPIKHNHVDHPNHYQNISIPINGENVKVETIEIINGIVTSLGLNPMDSFAIGNSLKYIMRSPFKNKLAEDLKKSAYYLVYCANQHEGDK